MTGIQTPVSGQVSYQILGPYEEYFGTYHITTYVHFVESSSNKWATNLSTAQIQQRTEGILQVLNDAYNIHGIYFTNIGNPCNESNNYNYEINETPVDFEDESDQDEEPGLHIFDLGGNSTPQGFSYNIPNTYLRVDGIEGGVPASHTSVLVHETGHCLGLDHTFAQGCDTNCPFSLPDCNCCGDFVCDTYEFSSNSINAEPDCSHLTLPPNVVRNYMSYVTPASCRNMFTPDQVKRMRAYLETAPGLQLLQNKTTVSVNAPESTSGNIIVDEDYTIDTPLEMLPGAYIRVKRGAKLTVNSTITGACGQMWRGIIVEGSTAYSQTLADQGKVVVRFPGKIEHAQCAIEVQDPASPAMAATGGGIVEIIGGDLENNSTGIRFGAYNWAGAANASKLFYADFSTTDDYRGGTVRPVYLDVTGIVRLRVTGSSFQDLRTQCTAPSSRALGIDLKDAGLRLNSGCLFKNLDIGLKAGAVKEGFGSYNVTIATFENCYTGILSNSTSSFYISSNNFLVKKPDMCSSSSVQVTGVKLMGNTTRFKFNRNSFYYDGTSLPQETLIGTDCMGLGEGMNNVIRENDYTNLFTANRAMGYNGYDLPGDGLVYLCNTNNEFTASTGGTYPSDYLVTEGSTIKKIQGEEESEGVFSPTGNVFSDEGYTFNNLGSDVDYYYYDGDPLQDPTFVGAGYSGLILHAQNESNNNCPEAPIPQCDPCTTLVELLQLKIHFYQTRQQWFDKKADLAYLTDSTQIQAKKDTIAFFRLEMNKDASRVLRHYELDTTVIELDTILTWLILAENYPADLRLSRHYFFTGDFDRYDTLWNQIPSKYELPDWQLDEFTELGQVYSTVRPHLESGGVLQALPQAITDSLKHWADWCSESGFLTQSLLWRNGIVAEPDCPGDGIGARAAGQKEETQEPVSRQLRIYPNPATDEVIIESIANFEPGRVSLFDMQGKLILVQALPSYSTRLRFSTSNLTTGIYFVEVRFTSGLIERNKLVITR
ncbi:MAG: zinc-dependent metalloprotease [Saprospiraceae bacterium]